MAPVGNLIVPGHTGMIIPLFDNGDWFSFDARNWRPDIPDGMMVEEVPRSEEERASSGVSRGGRLYGSSSGWICVNNPTGHGPVQQSPMERFLSTPPAGFTKRGLSS